MSGKAPERILVDNGSEFTSARFEIWALKKKVKILFMQPDKSTQKGL